MKIRRDRSSGRVRLGPLDLTIERGRRVLVLGGEGSGKSTLLELLAGRAQARRGAFHWDDEDVTECPEAVRASVAYLSDEPRFGRTAVRRLLGLPEAGLPSADDLRTLDAIGASRIVRRLPEGLEDRIASSELSPRERRTMVLGGIAIGDAPVWILDGPVDGNRTSDRRRIETIFERVGERTLVVAAPHAVAVDRFDRIVVLKNKKMSFAGTPEEWRAWRDQKKEPRDA